MLSRYENFPQSSKKSGISSGAEFFSFFSIGEFFTLLLTMCFSVCRIAVFRCLGDGEIARKSSACALSWWFKLVALLRVIIFNEVVDEVN